MITTYLRPLLCCFAAVGAATISPPANAIDASAWHPDTHSAVRLIAGGLSAPDPGMRAGVEIKLDPGWKTYWRYPGDSGVPPRFDFAQSVNVRSVKLLWPVPHHFVDEGGNSIGYKNDVIFPLQVVPQDPAKPVTLRLKIDYAICEKLCVPAVGNAELLLSANSCFPPNPRWRPWCGLRRSEFRNARNWAMAQPLPSGPYTTKGWPGGNGSSSTLPPRQQIRWNCLRKGRRRTGRCHCPSSRARRPLDCAVLLLTWTVSRLAPRPMARCSH
jgi:hypothetical protein